MPSVGVAETREAVRKALVGRPLRSAESFDALVALVQRAQAAHPSLDCDLTRFAQSAVAGCPRAEALFAHLEAVHAADLWAVTCALTGNVKAAAWLEAELERELAATARKVRADDDAIQTIRIRLLVGDRKNGPALSAYSGRGPLSAWVRVAVLRELYRGAPGAARAVALEAADEAVTGRDPELQYLRSMYTQHFRALFGEALEALTPRQRNLLRYTFLDRLKVDQIAAMHGVHRVSASRWLSEARVALADEVRRLVKLKLNLSASDAESLFRLFMSRPDISLAGLLEKQG